MERLKILSRRFIDIAYLFRTPIRFKRKILFLLKSIFYHDCVHWEIFTRNIYYFEADNLSPTIIDCGANVGLATAYFKEIYPKSTIYSFEPNKENFKKLKSLASKYTNVNIFKNAVGKNEKLRKLYGDYSKTFSLYNVGPFKETVKVIKLSKFMKEKNLEADFLKIDIEGAETDVLEDLDQARMLRHVKQMTVEYHHKMYKELSKLSVLLNILEKNGFEYQLNSFCVPIGSKNKQQCVLIYAYRK